MTLEEAISEIKARNNAREWDWELIEASKLVLREYESLLAWNRERNAMNENKLS